MLKRPPSRRTLFVVTAFVLALVVPAVQGAATPGSPSSPSCKSVPGDASWPSAETWNALNESVGGQLIQAAPPGAVCHPGQPAYDAALCPAVQSGWSTYEFHSDDPVSSDVNVFNNDTCLPDPSYPCSGAGYPVFVVNVTEAAHVQAAVNFGL